MAVCDVCEKRFLFRRLNRRLDIPEYRMMTGFWPWIEVRVCDGCLEAYDREFTERLRLLAPQVIENDEPIAQEVCLACGSVDSPGPWHVGSRWVDAAGKPARAATFCLCDRHRDLPYVEGVVIATNLKGEAQFKAVLDELPAATGHLLQRVEGWRPEAGQGPPAGRDFAGNRHEDEIAPAILKFWQAAPGDLEAKGAWFGPVRKDYRLRYRLDLVRDYTTGVRESLIVVRTARDRFATYRVTGRAPGK
ncbi:MAG: hypothetical protein FJ288_03000 [Planctomycetes bacterium]|nr:hypothetical protein [Planctomycetota bacterium]